MKLSIKIITSILLLLAVDISGQNNSELVFHGCAADQLILRDSILSKNQAILDQQAYHFSLTNSFQKKTNSITYIPVVVHIIHNGGPENISNAQVQAAITNINSKFLSNNNFQIQFCLAQRDPLGNPTNGITRDISQYTTEIMETEDILLKNINRWPPTCYLNIWVVKAINSLSMGPNVIGYAYFPSSHGLNMDGVVIEAGYFGSSATNDAVITHEIGHYLGLYHTFQNGCANNNCLLDGDQVCDTPPDQTTFSSCFPASNSCNTDADDISSNNPFNNDVADKGDDYMDYSSLSCYAQFTPGQYNRMQYFLTNTRYSLLNCLSCTTPCPAPLTAHITAPTTATNVLTGTTINFTGTATNSWSYKWYLNPGTTLSTSLSNTYTFNNPGIFWMKFRAISSNPLLCVDGIDSIQVTVIQPAVASCAGSLDFTTLNSSVHLPSNNQYYSSNGFTWECWVKLTAPFGSDIRPLILAVDGVVYEDICLAFGWVGGIGNIPVTQLAFKVDGPNSLTGPSSVSCGYAPAGGFALGTWYHVAASMDYVNHTGKLYLNGALVDTKTINSAPFSRIIPSQLNYDVGLVPGYPNQPLGGNMDEVRIWKRVRTDAEIASSYNICLSGNETDLFLYYRCDQSAGSLAVDATSNGNDGPLTSATAWSSQQAPLISSSCSSVCNDLCSEQVIANNDTVICPGNSAQLYGSLGFDIYNWIPSTSLNNSEIRTPVATPSITTTYTVTGIKLDTNLISNGDFSLGNVGFISNYTFNNSNFSPCHYSVTNDIFNTAIAQNDHTATNDNMFMMVDGCGQSPANIVWKNTVSTILPNTDYRFSFWTGGDIISAIIEIRINGTVINTFTYTPDPGPAFTWHQYSCTWNSGISTSATIELRDLELSAAGNNFGLDDFEFLRMCSSTDTVNIVVRNKNVPILNIGNDTSLCSNGIRILDAGPGFLEYHWNDGSIQQKYTTYHDGKYWVTVKDSCGAVHSDTILISLAPLPIIDFGNDKNICSGDNVLLTYTPSYIYHTYFWFPASGLSCVDCSSPYASPLVTTKYYLTTSTSQGCTISDSITINVNPKPNMYSLTTSSPYCEVNGRLDITTLNNNFAPYLFNLNNQGFSSQIEYQNLDAGSYNLQIKDKNGCIHDTSFVLDVNSDRETINIPNCFTPNGDQANELWLIKGSCIMNFECKIFNRWGEEVASFNNINNGWDGKNKRGQTVTDGIYFYVIDITYYSEHRSKKSGYISLFR